MFPLKAYGSSQERQKRQAGSFGVQGGHLSGLTSTQQGLFNHLQAPYLQGQHNQPHGAQGLQFQGSQGNTFQGYQGNQFQGSQGNQYQGPQGNLYHQDPEQDQRRFHPAAVQGVPGAPGGNPTSSFHSPVKRSLPPKPYRELELGDLSYSYSPSSLLLNRRPGQESVGGGDLSAPLSPISETANDERKPGSSNPRSVSAAVSDESVAGDSGVFEASSKKEDLGLSMNLETAQVQIKLRYSSVDSLLHIGIEKARNLTVLFIPEGRKV